MRPNAPKAHCQQSAPPKVGKVAERQGRAGAGCFLNYHNMKRINSRGMAQANKHVLMAALNYNLKKNLKFSPKPVLAMAVALSKVKEHSLCLLNRCYQTLFKPKPAL